MSAQHFPCLIDSIRSEAAALSALRRDLHKHPELGFEEARTANVIAATLERWGIPVHRGLATTGIVGVITKGNSSRAIGLRADMDALPIAEQSTFAHASVHAGKMHACGHDGHTAMLLGAAQYLARHRPFEGTVYLIFQPAEEGARGAKVMIRDGLFERFPMDAIFGMHNWPGLEAGQFAIRSGPVFASGSRFRITIRGRGAHAALPHDGIDPLPVACQIVQSFQTIITRNKRSHDTAVLSVTGIRAGEIVNAIPDTCEIQGTVRAFADDVLDLIERRMRQIVAGSCAAFDAAFTFEFDRYCPATVNHAAQTECVRGVLRGLVGADNVLEFEPTMGAEDFSIYLRQRPGCYFVIGNGAGAHRGHGHGPGPCSLHNSSYDFNDELIPLGACAWVRLVEAWFACGPVESSPALLGASCKRTGGSSDDASDSR